MDDPNLQPSLDDRIDTQSTPKNTGEVQKHERSRYKGIDITKEFFGAAFTLETGQLVKDELFTLFESVSALEIMDPKMDSGFLKSGESLDDDYDVLCDLLPEEVVGIMDQMLCLEIAWHNGHPLSQTLFTSIYIDKILWPDPTTLDEARFDRGRKSSSKDDKPLLEILRAYFLATIKTCDFILRTIVGENYYEEEDFVTNTYNRKLLVAFEPEDVLQVFEEARILVLEHEKEFPAKLRQALFARLDFRAFLLAAVNPTAGEGARAWERCLHALQTIEKTHTCGKPVPEAFSEKIQRRLASTVPPRPIASVEFADALPVLKRLCQDAMDVDKVLDYHGTVNTCNIISVLQSREPQPLVYVRSLLQSFLFQESSPNEPPTALGSIPVTEYFLDDLAEVALPSDILLDPDNASIEVTTDPRHQAVRLMDSFTLKAYPFYLDYVRACCMNRSRIHRMLCNVLPEWDNLQAFAEEVDSALQNSDSVAANFCPLTSWVYYHKLSMMQQVLILGCSLSIYAPGELLGVYWYIKYISQKLIELLNIIRSADLSEDYANQSHNQVLQTRHAQFLRYSLLQTSAIANLAKSLHLFYLALSRMPSVSKNPLYSRAVTGVLHNGEKEKDKNRESNASYAIPVLQHPHRWHPFALLSSPPFPSHKAFTCHTQLPDQSIALVLTNAEQAVQQAKSVILAFGRLPPDESRCVGVEAEWGEKVVKNMMKTAIAIGVGIGIVKRVVEAPEKQFEVSVEMPEAEPSASVYLQGWLVPRVQIVRSRS